MAETWKKLSGRVAYESPYLTLEEDKVIRPDGSEGIYSVVRRNPVAVIIALTAQKEIWMVHQFRYPTQTNSWELPMGGSDGQNIMRAGERELMEETGLHAEIWHNVGQFNFAPGHSDSRGHLFVAENLTQLGHNEQAEEGIDDCQAFAYGAVKDMILDGRVSDGPTIAALYMADLKGFL